MKALLIFLVLAVATIGCAGDRVYLLEERVIPDRYYEVGRLFSGTRVLEVTFDEGMGGYTIYLDDAETLPVPDIALVYKAKDRELAYVVGADLDSARHWENALKPFYLHETDIDTLLLGGKEESLLLVYFWETGSDQAYTLALTFSYPSGVFDMACYVSPEKKIVCFDPQVNVPARK